MSYIRQFGIKYTKNYQDQIGITTLLIYDENDFLPIILVESQDGSFMRYKPKDSISRILDFSNIVDDAINDFMIKSRKEKLKKLNEIQT